ncbi:TIGR02594 family protein [Methylobacterium sp. Leaf108]|uniref:NlpC/P60 family protein n=1 Tax=Methylobacterium sp. Leaf108 TaxID=1736256 RepID=UPI0006F87415|nr:TIGR02594 family protein [Methylobacterium sp. Leaf108]KQP61047.1 peptidoglycan-binding protein [Methylobacterium sp. Leaf108]
MDTTQIQRALLARGYDLGPAGADGDAGPKTIAAVTAFQRVAGLVADGIAGPKTQKALQTADITDRQAEPDKPGWLVLAEALNGLKEGKGAANNPEVVKLFADAGFPGIKTDSTAWCAAYVNGILERAGHRGSRSLAARSLEAWGVGLKAPVLGCIATKKRGNSTWQGHTGFVVGASKDQVFLLGGNQSDAVNVAAFKRSEITAFRWPSDVPIPASSTLPTTIAGARSGVSEA